LQNSGHEVRELQQDDSIKSSTILIQQDISRILNRKMLEIWIEDKQNIGEDVSRIL
jgi:hypothetical protein